MDFLDQYSSMNLEEMDFLKGVREESKQKKISLNSFLMLTVIGIGSYAKVILVKKKDDGKIYALKVLKKNKLKKVKQQEHLKTEREMLVPSSFTCPNIS